MKALRSRHAALIHAGREAGGGDLNIAKCSGPGCPSVAVIKPLSAEPSRIFRVEVYIRNSF